MKHARCEIIFDGGLEVFLPGCMGGAVRGIDGCTCPEPEDRDAESFPVCPWCGEPEHDPSGLEDESDVDCARCGKEYHCTRDVRVTYSTRAI